MNIFNKYQMKSSKSNGHNVSGKDHSNKMCAKCELKGHTSGSCYINLKRGNKCKSQTMYITNSYIKCTKCHLDGHSSERCHINLKKRRPLNKEKNSN